MAAGDTDNPLWRQRDPYGEGILATHFDWRDKRIIEAIEKFVQWGKYDSKGNIRRQKAIQTGALMRSVKWKTWQEAGGDVQVCFKAQRHKEGPGLLVSLGAGGETKEMVVSALAGSGSLMPDQGGWASRLVPWVSGDTKPFWLSLGAGQTA